MAPNRTHSVDSVFRRPTQNDTSTRRTILPAYREVVMIGRCYVCGNQLTGFDLGSCTTHCDRPCNLGPEKCGICFNMQTMWFGRNEPRPARDRLTQMLDEL